MPIFKMKVKWKTVSIANRIIILIFSLSHTVISQVYTNKSASKQKEIIFFFKAADIKFIRNALKNM